MSEAVCTAGGHTDIFFCRRGHNSAPRRGRRIHRRHGPSAAGWKNRLTFPLPPSSLRST